MVFRFFVKVFVFIESDSYVFFSILVLRRRIKYFKVIFRNVYYFFILIFVEINLFFLIIYKLIFIKVLLSFFDIVLIVIEFIVDNMVLLRIVVIQLFGDQFVFFKLCLGIGLIFQSSRIMNIGYQKSGARQRNGYYNC